jgi:ribonuclease D
MSADLDWILIESGSDLGEAMERIEASSWIGFDLEADSLHSYPERVCLIQIGCESGQLLIDSLAVADLEPLFSTLADRELIIHSCDYDLRLLAKSFSFKPSRVFDTKEAARILGMRQFGLSALTQEFLDVELEKSGQKADWSQRPLKPSLLDYARKDVAYLYELKQILSRELIRLGRIGWHSQTCERILHAYSRVEEGDPETVWRIKGYHKLNRLGLAVLRKMWAWREQEAVRLNRPPFFVLPHRKMIEIADAASQKLPWQDQIPRKFPARRRSGLIAAVQEGMRTRLAERPRRNPGTSRRNRIPKGERMFSFDELREHRDKVAEQLDMDPTVIASRSELEDLASNWEEGARQLMEWQFQLISGIADGADPGLNGKHHGDDPLT